MLSTEFEIERNSKKLFARIRTDGLHIRLHDEANNGSWFWINPGKTQLINFHRELGRLAFDNGVLAAMGPKTIKLEGVTSSDHIEGLALYVNKMVQNDWFLLRIMSKPENTIFEIDLRRTEFLNIIESGVMLYMID